MEIIDSFPPFLCVEFFTQALESKSKRQEQTALAPSSLDTLLVQFVTAPNFTPPFKGDMDSFPVSAVIDSSKNSLSNQRDLDAQI